MLGFTSFLDSQPETIKDWSVSPFPALFEAHRAGGGGAGELEESGVGERWSPSLMNPPSKPKEGE